MTFPISLIRETVAFVFGGKIAPIFFNTMEDAGALPIECDVKKDGDG